MPKTRLDYMRHGEPAGGSRFRGNGIDDPLSDKGWRQMRETAAAIDDWQHIVSSPMRRCLEFAQRFADEQGLSLEIQDDLREVGFGSWEGAMRSDLKERRTAEYDAFYRDPVTNRPPGAEPLDAFGTRVATVFEHLAATHAGKHLLVVAHAGVIRATIGHVLQAPPICWYRTSVAHAAVTRFARECQGTTHLVAHNWLPSL